MRSLLVVSVSGIFLMEAIMEDISSCLASSWFFMSENRRKETLNSDFQEPSHLDTTELSE